MATPIGHILAGYALYKISRASREASPRNLLIMSIIVAVSPDFDFVPGLVMGNPALFHQGITHSLGFALLVSVVIAGLCYVRGVSFQFIFTLCFVAYLSHLLIDFFGHDLRPPYGIPLLWPVSETYFISPKPIFWGVHHAPSTYASIREWVDGIVGMHNLHAIGVEIALLCPIIFAAHLYNRMRDAKAVKSTC